MTAPISFGVVSGSKPLSPSATESAPPTRAGGNTLAPVRKVDTLQLTDQGLELQQSMGSSRSHTDVDSQRRFPPSVKRRTNCATCADGPPKAVQPRIAKSRASCA